MDFCPSQTHRKWAQASLGDPGSRPFRYIYIYIYVYIYRNINIAVKLKAGPRFGGFKVKAGPSLKLKTGPSFFCFVSLFSLFYGVFWVCLKTQIVSMCAKIEFSFAKLSGCQKWGFRIWKCHFFVIFLCWRQRNRRKKQTQNGKRQKKTTKNSVFKGGYPEMRLFFCKILTLFASGREKKTRIFVRTICFGQEIFWPKQRKPGTTIRIVVSAEIAQTLKWHLFGKKKSFWHGWKSVFLLTVFFEKLCFLKTLFYSVFGKTQQLQYKKGCMLKNRKFMKIVGCFWTWQEGVFDCFLFKF